ncbi:hypothetical protein C0Q70_02559 [Pomacea canaliculata]|uniref:Uncharacterized protein n=1 Tax=Pomacea canaliculata TaxID=400727 RepID=A0A2T7PQ90_POMCA|nr:hypothetical protein C0Q70_02559 [Pomacea canaliculata]
MASGSPDHQGRGCALRVVSVHFRGRTAHAQSCLIAERLSRWRRFKRWNTLTRPFNLCHLFASLDDQFRAGLGGRCRGLGQGWMSTTLRDNNGTVDWLASGP